MDSLKNVTPIVLADVLRRQPLSPGKVTLAWQVVAGPALARATRVELDEQGALVVRTANAHWAREIDRSRDVLVARLQALLGPQVVTRLSIRAS